MYCASLDTPVGMLQMFADHQSLYRIVFPGCVADMSRADSAPKDHPLLNRAARQLMEYFNGSRHLFDLPLAPRGTPFQLAVWEEMQQIPYGKIRSYGEIASSLGNPNKARAVGGAANKNPLPIVTPCHRVMGASGSLTGFAGGIETKQFLLNLEKENAGG